MQTIAFDTVIEVYNKIKSKPKTYTELKNELKISNSTLSLCLQKLRNEGLIEKIIIDNDPHYTISKDSFIEKFSSDSKDIELTPTFIWLSSVAELDPEKYGIRFQYLKNIIDKDKTLVILEKNMPESVMIITKDKVIRVKPKKGKQPWKSIDLIHDLKTNNKKS